MSRLTGVLLTGTPAYINCGGGCHQAPLLDMAVSEDVAWAGPGVQCMHSQLPCDGCSLTLPHDSSTRYIWYTLYSVAYVSDVLSIVLV